MTSRRCRIYAARLIALYFAAAFVFTLWRAVTQPSAVFVADAVLYGGLAVLYGALSARGESEVSHCWGHLKPGTPFAHVFPDGRVPLKAPLPIVPREAGAPLCYLVPGRELSDGQITALAEMLWEIWRPECESPAQAADYIRSDALPLKQDWFDSVGTDMRLFLDWEEGE